MSNDVVTVEGRIIDAGNQAGLPGFRVEAWDAGLRCDEMLGSSLTKGDGTFKIFLDPQHLEELFGTRSPELFFRVHEKGEPIASTESSVLWRPEKGPVVIAVEPLGTSGPARTAPSDNLFRKRNQATRIDCFEAIDQNNRTALLSFFRRLGAPHFFSERVDPIMAQGDARVFAAVRDRPWPPWGLAAQRIYALLLAHPIGDEGYGITPVLVEDEDITNVGLVAAVYKEGLETLCRQKDVLVNYLLVEGAVVGQRVLASYGFERSDDEIFLTEDARYHLYRASGRSVLRALQIEERSTFDLLAYDVGPEVLDRITYFHAVLHLATQPALLDRVRVPEIEIVIDGGIGGVFLPGGVPPPLS